MQNLKATKAKCALLLVVSLFTVLGCAPSPERQAFPFERFQAYGDWNEIKTGSNQVVFKTLLTGKVKVPTSGMLDLSDSKTDVIKEDSRVVEVYSHWVHHPTKGDYLIDTGLDSRFRGTQRGSLKGLIAPWIIEDSYQQQGEDILSQINHFGIDVKGVFLTHVHGDHSAGIPALPVGIPVVLGKGESLHQYPLIMFSDHFDNVSVLKELNFQHAADVSPLGKMIDLFGDGSLWAISTPGHTTGHVSYLVNATEGWVLLVGDASHTRWGFENGVIPGWSEDDELARVSLNKLRLFSQQNSDVVVVYGHER